jgi:Flp pilus assembly secretin CpaC
MPARTDPEANMSAIPNAHQARNLARISRGLRAAATLAVSWLIASSPLTPARAQEMNEKTSYPLVDVAVDEARVVRINRPPTSVIIGNPLIADALIEENGVIVLLGRNYGTTNLIALGGQGEEIAVYDIVVRTSGRNAVSLFRGTARVALNCSPRCETELDVGDAQGHFDVIRDQIESKTGLSRAQAEIGE